VPFIHFDEVSKEYVTPKYSTAYGELVAFYGAAAKAGDRLKLLQRGDLIRVAYCAVTSGKLGKSRPGDPQ
jgi:hypothetical protein